MKLLDLLTAPWALLPAQLLEMQRIYALHLAGEKIDVAGIEARLGRPLANDQQDYRLEDGGVAVLTLAGVMAPKANLFMRVSGGISTQLAAQQVHSMAADPRVRAVVLAIDSPGGSVFGVPALAQAVRALAAAKPTVAVSEGVLASGAYWVGSAANAVYMEGSTDQAGSIGVVATHSFQPQAGRVTTEITAGRYKRMVSADKPLTEEGAAYLQQQVDHIYSVFVDAVADQRGATPSQVLEHMADGRVFVGQQAVDAGLVDGFSTVDDMVEQLATHPAAYASRRKAVFALGGPPARAARAGDAPPQAQAHPEGAGAAQAGDLPPPQPPDPKGPAMPQGMQEPITPVSRESLERDHPSLYAQMRTDFMAAGAAAELARVRAVLAEGQGMRGHEALVLQMAQDGKTGGPEAAQAILGAERSHLRAQAQAHAADAPQAPAAAAAPAAASEGQGKSRQQLAAEASAYAAKHQVGFLEACKALGIQH